MMYYTPQLPPSTKRAFKLKIYMKAIFIPYICLAWL